MITPVPLLIAKRPPALSVRLYVFVSPLSGSDPLTVPTTVPFAAFSATVLADKLTPVGASLTAVTVSAAVSLVWLYALVPPPVPVAVTWMLSAWKRPMESLPLTINRICVSAFA